MRWAENPFSALPRGNPFPRFQCGMRAWERRKGFLWKKVREGILAPAYCPSTGRKPGDRTAGLPPRSSDQDVALS